MITLWQNESGPVGAPTLIRSLNHLLDSDERGLAVEPTRTCAIPDCDKGGRLRRGWCHAHYIRWYRYGDPLASADARPISRCVQPDCSDPVKGLGLCNRHYLRKRRHGSPDVALCAANGAYGATCVVLDCDGEHHANGYCNVHYARLCANGTTNLLPARVGELNPGWRGDDVSYSGVHARLRRNRGPASDYACSLCAAPAAHWAYDHQDPQEKLSPLGPYSTDLAHYWPMCTGCHKRFDIGRHARCVSCHAQLAPREDQA